MSMRVPLSFLLLLCGTVSAQQYDAIPSTLYQDSAGTIPVTAAGQPVGLIRDELSTFNLAQPATATRCTYQVDGQGHGYVDCEKAHCLYSTAGYTAGVPAWVVAGYSVIGTGQSAQIFGARSANNAYIGIAPTTNAHALGGIVDPVLKSMLVPTALGSVSQGVVTVSDVAAVPGAVSVSMNDGLRWSKAVAIGSGYTLPGLRIGINTTSTGYSCGTNAVRFYGGAILSAESASEVQNLKIATGIASIEGLAYDIFPVWSQSNGMGRGNWATSTPVPFGEAAEYEDGAIKPLADPTRHYATNAVGNVSATGSMWPAFAAAYFRATGRHALLVGASVSSEGVTTTGNNGLGGGWVAKSQYRAFLANKTLAAKAFVQASGGTATIKALLFEDGEADALGGIDQATFESGMAFVRADINNRLGLPNLPLACISIDKTTDPTRDAAFATIRAGIANFCTTQPNAYLVAGYQDFADAGELSDGYIHWNQTALNFDGNLAGQNVGLLLP